MPKLYENFVSDFLKSSKNVAKSLWYFTIRNNPYLKIVNINH